MFIHCLCFSVPAYPKPNLKRDYGRREEVPLRSRPAVDYGSRVAPERRPSYRDDYATRGSGYNDIPRNTSRTAARRTYEDDAYGQRFERPPPPSYREGRPRDYDSIAGSKRPYGALVSNYQWHLPVATNFMFCLFPCLAKF